MSKSVILMSGGLDSVVALGCLKEEYNIQMALTFDYGQKSVEREINASKKICEHYNTEHKVIKLDWLRDITRTSLVSSNEIPVSNLQTKESAEKVWVPNRNALFLNVAACFADSYGFDYIIFGANKDEAETFSDNTELFREKISEMFSFSTMVKPKVVAPLINYTKDDIVRVAIEKGIPLQYLWSCYKSGEKHCGKCESCNYLKNALLKNGSDVAKKYLAELFE